MDTSLISKYPELAFDLIKYFIFNLDLIKMKLPIVWILVLSLMFFYVETEGNTELQLQYY